MSATFNRPREGVTIPRIWIAVMLSVLLHAAALWRSLPQLHHMTLDEPEQGANSGALAVRLAPPPVPRALPPEPPPEPAPKPVQRPPRPAVSQRAQIPPVLAMNKAATTPSSTPAPKPPVETAPPVHSAETDFASMVEARRRAREGAQPQPPQQQPSPGMVASAPAETEAERARRITAANLAQKQQVFGYDPKAGGGVFQIRRVSLYDAEFVFYGWNREVKRRLMQVIEVSKGNNSDIRIAVVRKMIAIIRENVDGDFTWESVRQGRDLTLSARPRDNAVLEDVLMREFFTDPVVVR